MSGRGLAAAFLIAAAPLSAAELKVLSYNVAGIPLLHEMVELRINAIANRLKDSAYDVVGVQEAWLPWDKGTLVKVSGFPHHARTSGDGVFGTGLLILSRHPILEARQHVFASRPLGYALDGEAFARKGAQLARIKTPWGELDVYNTHFTSPYRSGRYRDYRLMQAFELYEFVSAHSLGRPVLLMGDLNLTPEEPAVRILTRLLGLKDACAGLPEDACRTSRSGRHIDYVLIPSGARAKKVAASFEELLPLGRRDIPYSDHKAMEALLPDRLPKVLLRPDPIAQRLALAELARELEIESGFYSERSPRRRQIQKVLTRVGAGLTVTAAASKRR